MNYRFSDQISFAIYEDSAFIFDHLTKNEYRLNSAAGKILKKIEDKNEIFTAEETEFIESLEKLGIIASEKYSTSENNKANVTDDEKSVFDELIDYAAQNIIPASATFELTYKCNLNCIHCYIDKKEEEKELSAKKIKNIITEFRNLGGAYITFTGGDPLLKKDFEEIFNFTRDKHIAVSILSPCWNAEETMLKRIAAKGLFTFQLSFYGHNAEIHDRFTAKKGSFEKTLASARLLKKLGVTVFAAVTVSRENIRYFDEIISFLKKENFRYHFNFNIFRKRNGDMSPEKLNISEYELKEVLSEIKPNPKGRLSCLKPEDAPCNAARSMFALDPFGNIYPCLEIREICGSLKESSLKEIWEQSPKLNEIRNIRFDELDDCFECKFRDSCNRCSGTALKEGLSIKNHSETDCIYAKIISELNKS